MLDDDEIKRIREHARGTPIEVLVEVLLGTGLRISEMLALRWRDLDLANHRLRIERAQVERKGGIRYKGPKSERSRRDVELPRAVAIALRRHRAKIGAAPHPDRLVFTDAKGGSLRRSNVLRRQWHPLLASAGFGEERFGFHALRHTHGSHLCARGARGGCLSAARPRGHQLHVSHLRAAARAREGARARRRRVVVARFSPGGGIGGGTGAVR